MAELTVYLNESKVGKLWLDDRKRIAFQYDGEWIALAEAIPLSLSLPLRAGAFLDDEARPFFANLLPEADIRLAVARALGISAQNDFALLQAIGGECAGAVSLLPEAATFGKSEYRPLDDQALHSLVVSLPRRPFLAGEEGIRLSLAGAQNKLPVYIEDDRVFLPVGHAPSSHIIKPPIRDFPGTVENEAFCMMLAARMGLKVPSVSILSGLDLLYVIERYDRKRIAGGELTRIHQEDFCQALGVPPEAKYETEGGAHLRQCFELIKKQGASPAADLKQLLLWVAFNVIIGNSDAHAKNLAVLFTPEGPRLAPFYDLLCTAIYPELETQFAMKIGGENRWNWLMKRHWERFAEEVSIKPKMVLTTVGTMAGEIVQEAEKTSEQFHALFGPSSIPEMMLSCIRERARKILLSID